jgi:APA family basic amino acid/polyamine antiporter
MMNALFGQPGAICMAAAIMISTFGCNNGLILAGARVYYAMARDRLFFQKIATTNRFRVPAAALVAQGIWTALLVLPRTVTIDSATHEASYGNVYNQLLEYIVSADLFFYLLMVVAVILLRRTSQMQSAHIVRGVIRLCRSSLLFCRGFWLLISRG